MLDRCLTWFYPLVMKHCIRGWEPDPAVEGPHKLVPISCNDTIKSLEATVKALSYMVRKGIQEHLSSTDSAVIAAAKKLLEPGEDAPATTCDQFFLVPSVKYSREGRVVKTEETYKCAEPLGHDAYCISKEGYLSNRKPTP